METPNKRYKATKCLLMCFIGWDSYVTQACQSNASDPDKCPRLRKRMAGRHSRAIMADSSERYGASPSGSTPCQQGRNRIYLNEGLHFV